MLWVIDEVIHWHELDITKQWTSAITFATGVWLLWVRQDSHFGDIFCLSQKRYIHLQITEAQNDWVVEVERDLWRPPGPPPCSSSDTYTWLPRTMSRNCLNISREKEYNLSEQPVPVSSHPESRMCFLMFRGNLLYFSLFPLPLVLSLGERARPHCLGRWRGKW